MKALGRKKAGRSKDVAPTCKSKAKEWGTHWEFVSLMRETAGADGVSYRGIEVPLRMWYSCANMMNNATARSTSLQLPSHPGVLEVMMCPPAASKY